MRKCTDDGPGEREASIVAERLMVRESQVKGPFFFFFLSKE